MERRVLYKGRPKGLFQREKKELWKLPKTAAEKRVGIRPAFTEKKIRWETICKTAGVDRVRLRKGNRSLD